MGQEQSSVSAAEHDPAVYVEKAKRQFEQNPYYLFPAFVLVLFCLTYVVQWLLQIVFFAGVGFLVWAALNPKSLPNERGKGPSTVEEVMERARSASNAVRERARSSSTASAKKRNSGIFFN